MRDWRLASPWGSLRDGDPDNQDSAFHAGRLNNAMVFCGRFLRGLDRVFSCHLPDRIATKLLDSSEATLPADTFIDSSRLNSPAIVRLSAFKRLEVVLLSFSNCFAVDWIIRRLIGRQRIECRRLLLNPERGIT